MSGVPLSIATIASGSYYGTNGAVSPPGTSHVYTWLATVGGYTTPQAAPLTVLNGPLTEQLATVHGSAAFTNSTLLANGIPGDAAGVAVSGQSPTPIYGTTVSDFITYRFFDETLPAGVSFVLWEAGAGQAGRTASFSFSAAGPGDAPATTADWTFEALQPFVFPGTATVTSGGGVVDVSDGTGPGENPEAVVLITPGVPLTSLTVRATAGVQDSWGLALVNAAAQNDAPCLLAGTAIMTPDGPVAVERLRPGDPVLARLAGVAPVVWVGRRRLAPQRHARPDAAFPFRILRDAVAPGVPARDLLLSPDHAVCLGGVLIPVKYLANGRTVFQDRGFSRVDYWHVELARHDVLLAEALPVESYLDTGNRDAFETAAPAFALHPNFARRTWERDSCLPLWGEGGPAEQVRARLAARADMLQDAPVRSAIRKAVRPFPRAPQ